MREGEGNAHSTQYMRRFQTAGSAGRTGASTDAELIHEQQDRLALNILKRDIGRIRQTVLHISIHDGIGDSRQKAFFQLIAEGGHSRVFIRHVVHGQFTCGTEAYDVRRVFRAGTTPPFLMPAAKKRDEPRSLADIQHSDPLGGVELVPGKRQKVHRHLGQINRKLAGGLYGVGMEQDTPLLHHFSDLLNRKNGTGLIVGEHDGDNGRIFAHSVRQFVQIQAPFGIHAQIRQLIPLLLQMLPEGDKRRMFNTGRDDMLFFRLSLQSGHHGSGIAFRAARGEHDLFRLRTKHRRNLFPCILNALAHLPAERVHARGITIFFRKKRNHAFKNFRRYAGRGVVIEIDDAHAFTSSTTISGSTCSRRIFSTRSFNVTVRELQFEHRPRKATTTRWPSTSTNSISPPSAARRGRTSSWRTCMTFCIRCTLVIMDFGAGLNSFSFGFPNSSSRIS